MKKEKHMKPWARPAIKSALRQLEERQNKEIYFWHFPPDQADICLKELGWVDSIYEKVDFDCNEVLYTHPDYTCGLYLNYDGFTQDVFVYRQDKDDEPKEWRK